MNKRFIPFITLLFVIICNTNAYAEKFIAESKDMPLEINLAISSLQKNDPKMFSELLPEVMMIDGAARSLSKEDIFMIGKVEVYKTLLKNSGASSKQPVDGTTLETLRAAAKIKIDNEFVSWFIDALIKDCQELIKNPLYKEFLLQKNNNLKLEKIEYRKLEKKGELLQFWISKINLSAPSPLGLLSDALIIKMHNSVINFRKSLVLMAQQSSLSPLSTTPTKESELKFFKVKDKSPAPKKTAPKEETSKSVEDILAPITEPTPAVILPKPSQEDWTKDVNAPKNMQDLPKPANDAEWLQDF